MSERPSLTISRSFGFVGSRDILPKRCTPETNDVHTSILAHASSSTVAVEGLTPRSRGSMLPRHLTLYEKEE